MTIALAHARANGSLRRWSVALVVVAAPLAPLTASVSGEPAVALYLGRDVVVERTLADPTDLWVPAERLAEVNGFTLKPEGACLDDLCIPVEQSADNDIVTTRRDESGNETKWFSVTAFARRVKQAYAFDAGHRVWSFAPLALTHAALLDRGLAPDFELRDRQGKSVRLSDFRGKKVLLLTWASW